MVAELVDARDSKSRDRKVMRVRFSPAAQIIVVYKESVQKVIAVVGPTASGKSALGAYLTQKIGGEIISADSRQVYKGLNIGTGKITKKEMRGVRHHLLDLADG